MGDPISLGFEFDLGPFVRSVRSLGGHLDDELERCVDRAATAIAASAKAQHPYTDRTGRLTRSTRAHRAHGRFTRGNLQAEVVAGARDPYSGTAYGSFVEALGFAFLEPAWERVEQGVGYELEDALEAAVTKAGLR